MENISKNPVLKAFDIYQTKVGIKIKPDRPFYLKVGIKQKRWGQIIRGEKSPLLDELRSISDAWGIPIVELV
jgi:hypothetical protein